MNRKVNTIHTNVVKYPVANNCNYLCRIKNTTATSIETAEDGDQLVGGRLALVSDVTVLVLEIAPQPLDVSQQIQYADADARPRALVRESADPRRGLQPRTEQQG